jgi:5,10-methenyltetrahydromethanopterin hydrogenase
VEEIKALADGFRIIGRNSDAELIELALKKGKMNDKIVKKLLDHFRETDTVIRAIETEAEKFIKANIAELLKLQTL